MVNHNNGDLSSPTSSLEGLLSNLRRRLFRCINPFRRSCRSVFHFYAWIFIRDHEGADVLPQGVTLIGSFKREVGEVRFMAASSDGFLYTGCNSTIIWVWNKAKVFSFFYAISGPPINAILIGPQGHVISSHHDYTIRVWKRNAKNPTYEFPCVNYSLRSLHFHRHETLIYSCLCLSKDLRFLYSVSCDYTINIWRLVESTRNWRLTQSIKGHTQRVNAIATGSDGLMFSGSSDGSIRMFRRDVSKHRCVRLLLTGEIVVHALLFKYAEDGTGELYAGLADGTLRFWQQRTGWRHYMTLSSHNKAVTCVAALSGAPLVISGSLDGTICVWSMMPYGHTRLMVLKAHQGSVNCLTVQEDWEDYNNDGTRRLILYSGGQDKTLKIWRIAVGADAGN